MKFFFLLIIESQYGRDGERTSRASKHHIIITRCNKFGAILGSFDDGKGAVTPKPPLSAS